MSPRKVNSKKSSPKKAEEVAENGNNNINNESPTKQVKKTGLKLRLKVSSTESSSASIAGSTSASTSASVDDLSVGQEMKFVPKIKLNFSRSNESVENKKGSGKRGRPKKDKSAVLAAAIAASQPNEIETEERKSRRKAAEEKIKKSASMDSVTSAASSTFEGDTEGDGGSGKRRRGRRAAAGDEATEGEEGSGKRRRRRGSNENKNGSTVTRQNQSKSNEFIDITENNTRPINASNIIVHPTPAASNPHETEFIQRSKTFLNIAMQHDTFLYTSNLANPLEVTAFKSIEDAVEKLLAYHVGIGAGQYTQEELDSKAMDIVLHDDNDKHMKKYEELQEKYKSVIQSQSSKKVPTELLLLEQRLCLEEEKFLLVKLKNEYAAKFMMKGSTGMGSSGSSRPSTPSSNNSNSSRSDSVINQ